MSNDSTLWSIWDEDWNSLYIQQDLEYWEKYLLINNEYYSLTKLIEILDKQ